MSSENLGMRRSLSVVVFIDIVGYSKLMSANEDKTLLLIRDFVTHHLNPVLNNNNGKAIKAMGDGWMLSFPSCFNAISFAKTLKLRLAQEKLKLRYGIHMGDVQTDGADLYGDTVNIASRLESISGVNAITISNSVFLSLDSEQKNIFSDQGDITLKNISAPIGVWSTAEINHTSGSMISDDKVSFSRLAVKTFDISTELANHADHFEEVLEQAYQGLVSKDWLKVVKTDYEGPRDYVLKLRGRIVSEFIQISGNLTRNDGTTLWSDTFNVRPPQLVALTQTIVDEIVSQTLLKLIKYKKDFSPNDNE